VNAAAAKRLRLLASLASVLAVVALLGAVWFYTRLRASLPQLEGTAAIPGLSAAVTIERDALGVPTIHGQTREDAARALGWLHAQDRFFQMDVLRRNAAGELAAVFGKRALPRDKANRLHGFRALARQIVTKLPADEKALLDAYTAGLNAGLAALRAKPFEYYIVRDTPQPWQPEDTLLVGYSMALDLQDEMGLHERTLATLRDQLGAEGVAFFAPLMSPDDAALDGSTAPLPPIPGPRMLDLRAKKIGAVLPHRIRRSIATPLGPDDLLLRNDPLALPGHDPETVVGSNAFALAGAHTATGAALVANDMHLGLSVPNIWYRASLEYRGADGQPRKLTGVTLPGSPLVVAGSNGHVAWGFTASYADLGDLVVVEPSAGTKTYYIVPGDGAERIEERHEVIKVKGEADVPIDYEWTRWGPIVGHNEKGRALAHHWVAYDPAAIGLGLTAFADVTDVSSAVSAAHRAAIPTVNMLVGDAAGHIAWTLAGRLPNRFNYDGRLPVPWAYGDRGWNGLLPSEEMPTVTNPASGRLWSGNQRMIGGDALKQIGDGGYPRPARAAQIRDDLAPLERATPRDLLAVQLDDRALFLAPWHKLLMDTLTPAVTAAKKPRAALRAYSEKWEGHATPDAVSYPIVKQFRVAVYARVFDAIFASCLEADPTFNARELQLEPAIRQLLREKPAHLLNPEFATWDDLLVAAADDVISFLDKQGITLPQANWGARNVLEMRHPFGWSMPSWITSWLNMPADRLPGDVDMPRVQQPRHGASERFVVSPGHEAEGIFHMPGGQSGHPLSPYYRAGHEAWAKGEPTPFLPGKPEHTLTLRP
jgi:penicillin amidase